MFHVPAHKQLDPAKAPGQIVNPIPEAPRAPDFSFSNHGTICILTAHSVAAQNWADENLPEDRTFWGRNGTVIEPRYADAILNGIVNDGLEVA